jgi:hypothetical protein
MGPFLYLCGQKFCGQCLDLPPDFGVGGKLADITVKAGSGDVDDDSERPAPFVSFYDHKYSYCRNDGSVKRAD